MRIIGAASGLTALVLIAGGLGALFGWRPSVHLFPVALVAACAVLAFGVGAGLLRALRRPRVAETGALSGRRGQLTAGAMSAVGTAVLTTLVGLATTYPTRWDPAFVMGSAGRVIEGTIDAEMVSYLESFPNNLLLLAIDRAQLNLAAGTGLDISTVVVLTNAVLVGVLSWSVFVMLRRLVDAAAGLVAQLLVLVLIGLNPIVVVPYTDLPAATFGAVGAAVLALTLTRPDGRRALLGGVLGCALAGLALGVAAAIKPTMLGPAAGAVLALLLLARWSGGRRRPLQPRAAAAGPLGAAVLSISIAAMFLVVGQLAPRLSGIDDSVLRADRAWTPRMYLAQGLSEHDRGDRTFYGSYDLELVEASIGRPSSELDGLAADRITATLAARGWTGMAAFEANKLVWTWGDGTWFAYGEGGDSAATPTADSAPARWVQQWNSAAGPWASTRFALAQGIWTAMLIAGGLGLLRAVVAERRRRRRSSPPGGPVTAAAWPALTLLVLPLLGGIAWAQLFEGRSRYLLGYAVWIIALAFIGSTGGDSGARKPHPEVPAQ